MLNKRKEPTRDCITPPPLQEDAPRVRPEIHDTHRLFKKKGRQPVTHGIGSPTAKRLLDFSSTPSEENKEANKENRRP